MNSRLFVVTFMFALLAGVAAPRAKADQDNKEIRFTINAPVEIPGAVLEPGRYELKLNGNGSTVAGLWNIQGNTFCGFFNTILVNRAHGGHLRIDLSGSGKRAPKRLADWFYPGDRTGNEILYPVAKRVVVAKRTSNGAVISR